MDIHSHQCLTCGRVWEHDGDEMQKLTVAGYDAGHTCCGQIQRDRIVDEAEIARRARFMSLLEDFLE